MSDYMRDEVIYEEGWRGAGDPDDTPAEGEPPLDEAPQPDPRGSLPLLITLQLALCVIAALLLFILKASDSELYRRWHAYFKAEMNKPLISQDFFGYVDVFGLASHNDVELKATGDELHP